MITIKQFSGKQVILRYFRFFFILIFLQTASHVKAYADKYPFNYNIDVLHYAFDLVLSDTTDEINGTASISMLFKKEGIKQVRLDLVNKTAERKSKGMEIVSITLNGQALQYSHANNEVFIQLPNPSAQNERLIFIIKYHGVPADGLRIGPTKYGDRSFFSENWPNTARHWLPCVDHPYDKATSEFIIKAPTHYQVISNGLLMEETNLDSTTRLTHWKQSVPVSCWLFVLGVADFAVQYVGEVYGKSIQTWAYAKEREAGFYDFAEPTKQVVEFFSTWVGPYMYEKVANITSTCHGGMETSSAIFYNENLVTGKRTKSVRNVVIHELAHQWFGNAVTESTWNDVWLSEGFATFFTLLFIEHAYGHDEYMQELLTAKKMIFAYHKKDSAYSVISERSPEDGPVTVYDVTYQKGAWVLHMLRHLTGDENFQKAIRSYYTKFVNANATTDDFLHEMEKVSGRDLTVFFDQWLYHSEMLMIKGTWKYDAAKKQVVIKLHQSQQQKYLFDVPVEIGVYKEEHPSPEISVFSMNAKQMEYKIPVNSRPEKVMIDPNTVLLATIDFTEKK
jgi:aminopeptidase N